ncbi:hypothetical protein CC86DRAFT_403252 [Ophiobolus disseminans]|uniref:Uncharacterized protein n=1 Tax=Ophiobolus disseminans TaxID=1469910 RepID=A0A6A7A9N3_9PLEO|nr:hypothetical protein CC86DRAFT_403252 [Ophiobolus disseminans]
MAYSQREQLLSPTAYLISFPQRKAKADALLHLNSISALEQQVLNLETTHAAALRNKIAEVADVEAKNTQLQSALGQSGKEDNAYLELQLSAASTQDVVCELEDKLKGLELQFRERLKNEYLEPNSLHHHHNQWPKSNHQLSRKLAADSPATSMGTRSKSTPRVLQISAATSLISHTLTSLAAELETQRSTVVAEHKLQLSAKQTDMDQLAHDAEILAFEKNESEKKVERQGHRISVLERMLARERARERESKDVKRQLERMKKRMAEILE